MSSSLLREPTNNLKCISLNKILTQRHRGGAETRYSLDRRGVSEVKNIKKRGKITPEWVRGYIYIYIKKSKP